MWRLGRRLYCYARNELPVGPLENGEYQLLDYFMKISTNKDLTIFDIGGNKGEWTIAALESSKRYGVKASIHIFEPANDSFSLLQHKFEVQGVKLNKMAVSNSNSVSELFVCGNFCGTNSLYANQGGVPEKIQSIRLDEYVAQHKINHIDFVKSDTEGHDFNVLKSAENLLCEGRVIILQFEYNWRWINARCYLRDVFDFISDKPYWLGKLSASGVEIYKDWHPELDRFFETNYVLVRKDYEAMSKIIKYSKFNSSNIPISFE
jgi:FkbM family methyltransferase